MIVLIIYIDKSTISFSLINQDKFHSYKIDDLILNIDSIQDGKIILKTKYKPYHIIKILDLKNHDILMKIFDKKIIH